MKSGRFTLALKMSEKSIQNLSSLDYYTFRFDNGKIIPTLLNCMLVILVRNVMSGMHSMYYISSSDLFKVAHYKLSSLSFPRTKNVSVGS